MKMFTNRAPKRVPQRHSERKFHKTAGTNNVAYLNQRRRPISRGGDRL